MTMTVLASLMWISWSQTASADEQITLSAKSEEIADGLDLRAVANLFARSKDLQTFEKTLNNPDSAFTNLDLNGDGDVDYIRVVETKQGNKHTVLLQAILAQDIYQDVATIIIDKDDNGSVSVKVTGDERIYGVNYVIEPVFYYRPIIYDWFWGPDWYIWNSPYYWGGWPGWWRPFPPCRPVIYINRCMCCCNRGGCSYRTSAPVHTHDAVRTQRVAMAREGAARVDGRAAGAATRTAGRATAAQRTVSGSAAATRSVDRTGLSRTTTVASATRQPATRQPATAVSRQQTTTAATRQPATTVSRQQTTTASRPQVSTTATRPTTMTASVSRPTQTTTSTTRSTSSMRSSSSASFNGASSRSAGFSGGGFSGGARSAGFSGGGFSGGASHGGGGGHASGGRR